MNQSVQVSQRASLSYRLTVASWAGLLCYQIYCVVTYGEPWIIALGHLAIDHLHPRSDSCRSAHCYLVVLREFDVFHFGR